MIGRPRRCVDAMQAESKVNSPRANEHGDGVAAVVVLLLLLLIETVVEAGVALVV
jgi:hypothetical protein